MLDGPLPSILFVCSGNVFRSVVAEYALKAQVSPEARGRIGSAGIEAFPQTMHPLIQSRLREKGADPSRHVQRKLTAALLQEAEMVVAMGLNHRDFIRQAFGRDALLFNQICYEREEGVLDVGEAIPKWEQNLPAAGAHILSVIDHIWSAMPAFLARIGRPGQVPPSVNRRSSGP